MAMIDDEQLLDDMCVAWRGAEKQRAKAEYPLSRQYWAGVANGLACGIAVASGVPERIRFNDAARAGADIARARAGARP